MAEVVNLDALIPREDFNSEELGPAAGQKGKVEVSKTDLAKGESFYLTIRKPDFQRETAAWSPEAVCNFIESFVNGDLIPAVVCWQSASRLTFVIDGAHRLSAVMAWLQDDYGAGDDSVRFYGNNIPLDQRKIHEKTKLLVNQRVGSYKDIMAESKNPGSNPKLTAKALSLGNAVVPLLWVKDNDSKKAERAFLTINQSAVQIEPTEFAILNARHKPNAIAARAIVRNATGHKYWKDFSTDAQNEVEKISKRINRLLYSPPLDTSARSPDLPIAGHGYGTQTLPLIFDFVNIANDVQVVDSSKKRKRTLEIVRERPSESDTLQYLKNTDKLANRFTGTHESSLGLHPAVYFYATNGRHQPTAVLAIGALIMELNEKNEFSEFTRVRKDFERFLVDHKMYINQMVSKQGSMAKGYRPLKEYYRFILDKLIAGRSDDEVEQSLQSHIKYQRLVKERPTVTVKSKKFSRAVQKFTIISDILDSASICEVCGARMDLKSTHIDHTQDRSKGGSGSGDNARLIHPYCDSTYKGLLEGKSELQETTA